MRSSRSFNVAYGAQEHENFEVLSKKHGISDERVLEMVAHIHRILDRYHAYLTEKIILAQADTSSSGH